ncbi:MAG: hypothetical protein Q8R15_03885 [Candidatus Micrarchaeota archaeon]|nr:hypothetical protein [Candidatus Micrarchaeota archaeon]
MSYTLKVVRGEAGQVNLEVIRGLSRGRLSQEEVPAVLTSKLCWPILSQLEINPAEKKLLKALLAHGPRPADFIAHVELTEKVGVPRSVELLTLLSERLEHIKATMHAQVNTESSRLRGVVLHAAGNEENLQRHGRVAPMLVGNWIESLKDWHQALLNRNHAEEFLTRARENPTINHPRLLTFLHGLHSTS